MATQIQIFDTHKNEVELNDIVVVNYPNPNYFFIGKVQFNHNTLQFEVYDGLGYAKPLTHSGSISFEKLCSGIEYTGGVGNLGAYHLKDRKPATKKREQILSSFKPIT